MAESMLREEVEVYSEKYTSNDNRWGSNEKD
jgi:hypothetical protein